MPSSPSHSVAVLIPTAGRGPHLARCLASLRTQTFSDFETCIISDGGGESVKALALEFRARVLEPEGGAAARRGFAVAVNAGIRASRAPYVAVLNDDVELHPDWLRHLVGVLESDGSGQSGGSRPDFCCGKILAAGGETLDGAGDALSLGGAAWRLGHGRKDAPEFDLPRPLLAVSGTAALFRRRLFDEIGLFDESFGSYLEDVELSLRAMLAGRSGLYVPAAICNHVGGATSGGARSPFVVRQITRNQLLLLATHYSARLLWRAAPRILCSQMLWAAMALRRWRALSWLRGIAAFLVALPRALQKRRVHSPADAVRLCEWLRESERAIYADIMARAPGQRDAFWRMYFALFPPHKPAPGGEARPATAPRQAGGGGAL